jgi:hypothetical protein
VQHRGCDKTSKNGSLPNCHTQIDIYAPKTAWKPRHNFRMADWPELVKTLKTNLANIPPPTEIESVQEFNDRLKTLNKMIQDTIKEHVKLTTPSPYSKRWWTTELANEKKKCSNSEEGQSITIKTGNTRYMKNTDSNTTDTWKQYEKQKQNTG